MRGNMGFASLLLTAILWACGGGDASPGAVREDSAGVEIVRHAGADRPLDWSFERVAVLGGEAEGPESFTSVYAFGIDVDSTGRLHVLDRDAFRIVVFDSALSVERTLGSEGEGPGELAGPLALDVRPGGEVAVFDYARGGLVRWGPDGASLPM